MPEQTGLADAAMVTLTARTWLTTMVTGREVTGFASVQSSDEVRVQ